MVGGRPPPASFLQFLMCVIPKGTSDADSRCVRRSPGNLRPFSLLDCDSKLVMSAIAEPFNLVAQHIADWRQRGFVRSRVITGNTIDVEADAIVVLITGLTDPGMVFMDFGTAFPSLFH